MLGQDAHHSDGPMVIGERGQAFGWKLQTKAYLGLLVVRNVGACYDTTGHIAALGVLQLWFKEKVTIWHSQCLRDILQ